MKYVFVIISLILFVACSMVAYCSASVKDGPLAVVAFMKLSGFTMAVAVACAAIAFALIAWRW